MNRRVREILMDMATRRLPQGPEHVFRGADGQESPQKADRWFPRAVAKARHVLTEAGRQADAEMLGGWRTVVMVTRYAHLMPGRLREGVERLVTTPAASRHRAGTDTGSDTTASPLVTL